ncbi:alpha/beta hydrolase [Microvirga makkahensis]|uniref:Phospholipase n=1 Tax=Microvirga makkahensis TaxID=1128670 RepID=A0A7X3SP77_9HYPH|nr:phospholipase [Microvirga makkahensis]MXQ11973.1 phospholipase [Microvirga makkahensis]
MASPSSAPSSAHVSGRLSARPETIVAPASTPSGHHALELGRERDGIVFIPPGLDPTRPAPLIVGLHGAGGIASQMLDLLGPAAAARGIIVLGPESRGQTWDVIRGGYGPDVAFIDEALRKVFRMHPVDPARIAVSGFSDGASYALSLGIINGELFDHVLAFSPGFMAPTRTGDTPRIFISHGVRDEVLPIDPCSRRIVPALENAGYDVEYREFDGGHVVPTEMVGRSIDRFLG